MICQRFQSRVGSLLRNNKFFYKTIYNLKNHYFMSIGIQKHQYWKSFYPTECRIIKDDIIEITHSWIFVDEIDHSLYEFISMNNDTPLNFLVQTFLEVLWIIISNKYDGSHHYSLIALNNISFSSCFFRNSMAHNSTPRFKLYSIYLITNFRKLLIIFFFKQITWYGPTRSFHKKFLNY